MRPWTAAADSGYNSVMRKLLAALLMMVAAQAHALQFGFLPDNYFRPIDVTHPIVIAGAAIDPVHLGDSRAVSLVPLATHSPSDGCLLPAIVCEDWTPAAIGGSVNAGKLTFDIAPLANVLPWAKTGLLAITPTSWAGVRKVLTPAAGQPAVTFSVGPMWEYRQLNDKGYLMVVTALALHF